MQALPSHSQRQLVSGKVGWGWRQATLPISANFGFAGFLMLVMAIAQLVQIDDMGFLAIAGLLLIVGMAIGLYAARSVVEVCRQNSDYVFSQWQLIGITAYWLLLVTGLSVSSEAFVKTFVAIWWILPAAIFMGISMSLGWRSKSKSKAKQLQDETNNILAEVLNIITYSDSTVVVSPSSLGQQPRQFNSLVLILLGLFFWTMLDFPNSIRAISAITFTIAGLTGFFVWQIQLRSQEKILYLRFSGLWGMAATYAINISSFSRLSISKLQESNGELSWMQLGGDNTEITLPLAMTMFAFQSRLETKTESKEGTSDPLGQVIRKEFHLANQESERDSLGLAHVLLPQGAGLLAGVAFITGGILLLLFFPLPTKLSAESVIAWLGVCTVSPSTARFLLQLVAPSSLRSKRLDRLINHLQTWEVGTAFLLISTFLSIQMAGKTMLLGELLPILTLIFGWLSLSIGVCIFTFVRRTPLWHDFN